ncbi:MAG: DUF4041 domain-containing protein [Spirochaetaceae bacterium]
MSYIIIIEALVILILFVLLVVTLIGKFKIKKKYSPIIDMEKEVNKRLKEKKYAEMEIEDLRTSYKEKRIIYDQLVQEAAIYNEQIELAELGFYSPQYSYDTSEKIKDTIDNVKNKQKLMIKDKSAIYCNTEWTVEGSKAKGRTMTNRNIRMTARAFNNECDSAISSTKWNNVSRMVSRIEKAFSAINKLNDSNKIYISPEYLSLKLEELTLTHEYKEKKQEEKEEQAELKRQMKEEAKIVKEAEIAEKELLKQEELLNKIRREVEDATGDKLNQLQKQINDYEDEIEKNKRKISLAQQTKRGVVYIISNIGSFGDNIYKIGMTRREDPMERVKELSSASVPFSFDIHAKIKSEDAPALEKSLHKIFKDKRVNLVNNRKEFFNVNFDKIRKEVDQLELNAEIFETIEAREYRETQALRKEKVLIENEKNTVELPQSI